MKNYILLIIAYSFFSLGFSQTNLWTLIDNPDFEEYNQCPTTLSNVNTDLVSWFQVTDGTPDYHNYGGNCGSFNHFTPYFEMPEIPNRGNGFVGFTKMLFGDTNLTNNQYKEYFGTCLKSSLVPGEQYKLDFKLSAAQPLPNAPSHATFDLNPTISIFGFNSCNPPSSKDASCLLNLPGWVLLGEVSVNTLTKEWTTHTITFTAPVGINSIAIGPDCKIITVSNYVYYFFDAPDKVLNTEIGIPNVFSPNADGNNDLFELHFDKESLETATISIYDRWGIKVFETSDLSVSWDGTYKGEKLNSAVFVYHLNATFKDGAETKKTGNIAIVR